MEILVGHLASACRSSGPQQPKAKGGGQKGKGGKVQAQSTRVEITVSGDVSSQCSKKKVHAVEYLTTASQVVSQDTTIVGTLGDFFDFGSVSDGILEPRGAGEEICSVGVSSVREGEFVDIEVDSGA